MHQQHFEQQGDLALPAGLSKKIKNFVFNQKDQIGKGYSSVVYRGQDEVTKDDIAVKVVELTKIKNEVQRHLLNNEMRALRKLDHPHIIRCLDILMTKNNIYIVTEFCRGGDMIGLIKQHGRLPEQQALAYLREIAEGYVNIEENGILHRDLKTANIFLDGGTTRIADFGFCEFVGEPRPSIAYNVGSPAYMSPESYRESLYSSKSDVWSIGIIFYEMLVGEVPFKKCDYAELTHNLTNGNLGLPSGLTISEASRQILIGCFKEKLTDRLDPKRLLELASNEVKKRHNQKLTLVQPQTLRSSFEGPIVIPPQHDTHRTMQHAPKLTSEPQIIGMSGQKFAQSPPRIDHSEFQQQVLTTTTTYVTIADSRPTVLHPQSIRQYIEYIMFLHRLAKICSEGRLSLPLGELLNRNLLGILKNIASLRVDVENMLDACNEDSAKEYHYLISRFQELGLTEQKLNNAHVGTVTNSYFRQQRAISDCMAVIKSLVEELDRYLSHQQQVAGVLMDYLILYYELLQQELECKSPVEAVRVCRIPDILKDKPRAITDQHVRLLRLKRAMLRI